MRDTIFSLPIIIVLTIIGGLLLRRKRYALLYREGVRDGIRMLYELFPSLLLLCISVKLISSCGVIEDISALLSHTAIGEYVDSNLIPIILTRPISGSASTALFSELIEKVGANSSSVLIAAVILSSSDTCIYIHSTYFSCVSPKRNGMLLALMLIVSFVSCITCIFILRAAFDL